MKKVLLILTVGFLILYFLIPSQKLQNQSMSVGIMFFGDDDADISNTIQYAKLLNAKYIYMYVAYGGKAYFDKPKINQTFGLKYIGDKFLKEAIKRFHKNDLKVICVLSTQLFGANPQKISNSLLQSYPDGTHADLIDPLKARSYYCEMVKVLLKENIDGIYVGEPYYKDYLIRKNDPKRSVYWDEFYKKINKEIKMNSDKKSILIFPVHFFNYQGYSFGAGIKDHGLNRSLVSVGFDKVGLDLSSIYNSGNKQEIMETGVMTAIDNNIKGSIAELSLNKFGTNSIVPLNFILSQIRMCKEYHINHIVLFSNKSLDNYSVKDIKIIRETIFKKNDFTSRPSKTVIFKFNDQSKNWRSNIANEVSKSETYIFQGFHLKVKFK